MKRYLFVFVIALFVLSGCGGIGVPNVAGQKGSLTLTMVDSGVKAQTIEPDLDMRIATYDIAGSGPNGTSFHKNNIHAGLSVTITALAVGPWTISVDAKNSDGTNIAAGYSQVQVTAGAPTTAEVIVQPLEGNGALSLQISWPSGLITNPNAVGTLIPQMGGSAINVPFSISGETASCENLSLAAGYYTLQVKLQDDVVNQWGAADVVRIIAGQTTNGGFPLNARPGKTGKIELVVVPDLQNPITIGFCGQQEILPVGTDMTVTATPDQTVDRYQWYLNGELLPEETGGSITIGSALGEGSYRLDLIVTKGNIAGAGSINFKVTCSTELWANIYEGWLTDAIKCSQKTPDGGVIMGGYSWSFTPSSDMWLVKLNFSGAIEWQKAYGGPGEEEANSIAVTSDGGFIVVGTTGISNIIILKLNQNGDLQWQKIIAGSDAYEAHCIIETSDHGFIIAGSTFNFDAAQWDCWIIKLNNLGNVEWQKSYGGPDWDKAFSICQTTDGGYIVGSQTGGIYAGHNYLVFKINSTGSIQWQKTYSGNDDFLNTVTITSDGKYVVSGYTQSYANADLWLLKLNTDGTIIWQKAYGGYGEEYCYSTEATTGGALIVSGHSSSFYSYSGGLIMRLDNNGRIEWQKTFTSSIDNIVATQTVSDGYITTGTSFGGIYALKLRSDGTCPPLTVDTDITPVDTSSSCINADLTVLNTNAMTQDLNFDVTITNATITNLLP